MLYNDRVQIDTLFVTLIEQLSIELFGYLESKVRKTMLCNDRVLRPSLVTLIK